MPGFHRVTEIYKTGQFWGVSDKAYPYFHNIEGTRRVNLYEWDNYWNSEINGGVEKGDANFTDTILGNLSTWNDLTNARFQESFDDLKQGLMTYYGYKEEDFE